MEIRVIKTPSRVLKIANLNAAFAAIARLRDAAVAAPACRQTGLNRRFNYQNILLLKTKITL